jgi:hypothetical protein
MKRYRRLWMVAVITACLGGCGSDAKDGDNSAGSLDSASAPRGTSVDGDDGTSGSFGNTTGGGDARDPAPAAMMSGSSGGDHSSDEGESFGEPTLGSAGSGGASGSAGASAGEPPSEDTPSRGVSQGAQSGTLTAGAWDDNLNFDRFSEQRSALLQSGQPGALPTTDKEHKEAHEKWSGDRDAHSLLDISLVIDTTGSMGDEITYLQTELDAISKSIQDRYPDAEQRWSLIAYRDEGDDFVTRVFDFTDDLAELRSNLNAQSAGGGGDFPEAPDAALAAMDELEWREGSDTARVAFWIADAPHHAENAEAMADAIRSAAAIDVHIYPVASSGVDDLTELTMRSSAQLTGGRYLFLTDDSGVGGSHKEPNIPCYFVTRLDQAMLRMVDIEISGEYRQPDADQIIRTGGDPSDGACTLESGDEVEVF